MTDTVKAWYYNPLARILFLVIILCFAVTIAVYSITQRSAYVSERDSRLQVQEQLDNFTKVSECARGYTTAQTKAQSDYIAAAIDLILLPQNEREAGRQNLLEKKHILDGANANRDNINTLCGGS